MPILLDLRPEDYTDYGKSKALFDKTFKFINENGNKVVASDVARVLAHLAATFAIAAAKDSTVGALLTVDMANTAAKVMGAYGSNTNLFEIILEAADWTLSKLPMKDRLDLVEKLREELAKAPDVPE